MIDSYTMIEENLGLPLETHVLGEKATGKRSSRSVGRSSPFFICRFQRHQFEVRSGSRLTIAGCADASERIIENMRELDHFNP
jgi:hypothetical protein